MLATADAAVVPAQASDLLDAEDAVAMDMMAAFDYVDAQKQSILALRVVLLRRRLVLLRRLCFVLRMSRRQLSRNRLVRRLWLRC